MVSIIIPIYNVGKWLPTCIESIQAQSYVDWEMILIDDGSEDESFEVAKAYQLKDERIKIVRQANQGPGAARNAGIDIVLGEWIVFIDADDYIDKDYLQELQDVAIKDKSDLVVTGYAQHLDGVVSYRPTEYVICDKQSLGKGFMIQRWPTFNYVWGKMFSSKIIRENNLRFDETITLSEDYLFMLNYIVYVRRVVFANNNSFYHYVRRSNSLSYNERILTNTVKVHQEQIYIFENYIKGRFSEIFERFIGRYIVEIIELLVKLHYKKGNGEKLRHCLNKRDINYFREYKTCISVNEWILKQILCFGLVKLYAYISIWLEGKTR